MKKMHLILACLALVACAAAGYSATKAPSRAANPQDCCAGGGGCCDGGECCR
jgi:hypothetical protein